MKTKFTSLILFIFSSVVFSQHTTRFLEVVKDLKPIDSTLNSKMFNNGKLKEIGTIITYELGDYDYEFYTGTQHTYYNNGQTKCEVKYDSFGNLIYSKSFDRKGKLLEENITYSIDSSAKNIDEFLNEIEHTTIVTTNKIYYYSYKYSKWYLHREGMFENITKIGTWKFYSNDGELTKTKIY